MKPLFSVNYTQSVCYGCIRQTFDDDVKPELRLPAANTQYCACSIRKNLSVFGAHTHIITSARNYAYNSGQLSLRVSRHNWRTVSYRYMTLYCNNKLTVWQVFPLVSFENNCYNKLSVSFFGLLYKIRSCNTIPKVTFMSEKKIIVLKSFTLSSKH